MAVVARAMVVVVRSTAAAGSAVARAMVVVVTVVTAAGRSLLPAES